MCDRPLENGEHCVECRIYWNPNLDPSVIQSFCEAEDRTKPIVVEPLKPFVCRVALTSAHQKWLVTHADPGCHACFGLGYYVDRSGSIIFCKCVDEKRGEDAETDGYDGWL